MQSNRLRFWWRYLRRRIPWDTGQTPPEITAAADRLAPGRALDLGCGTGTSALSLAQRGWQVVGVDFVPTAIHEARRKAREAGVQVEFHVADVTRLDFLEPGFDLAYDIGCLHAVPPAGRPAYARQLTRLVCPGAIYLLYAFLPGDPGRRPPGLALEEVMALFNPGWHLETQVIGRDRGRGSASAWYTLRRVDDAVL